MYRKNFMSIKSFLRWLSPTVRRERWPKATEEKFRSLAREDPGYLIRWIQSGNLRPSMLTFAAETLGDTATNSSMIADVLLGLTKNKSALVREGAIYGTADYLAYPGIADRIHYLAQNDLSLGVREAATDILTLEREKIYEC
jgi:hypothetical protein